MSTETDCLAVPCATCGAEVGVECHRADGRPRPLILHAARIYALDHRDETTS